nr:winged helix-turn-helix domain-containing protein [Streptomyces sp. SID2119]
MRTAVTSGRLAAGSTLPASRVLAADLRCSRWVVTEAYAQLVAEGYFEARSGSATRVRARTGGSVRGGTREGGPLDAPVRPAAGRPRPPGLPA